MNRQKIGNMKRLIKLGIFVFFGGWINSVVGAEIPVPPDMPVQGYVLMDYYSGEILAEKNADKVLEPASLTKLMTAYLVYKSIAGGTILLPDEVLVSEKAWRMEGSRMFIEVGSKVSVDNLLTGLVVQSGNDAAVALSEHVAGSESAFASLMNMEAKRLGMKDTHFMNATGLPHEQHYSTARDMAKLARALIHDFPDQYQRYSIKEFTYNKIKQPNRNRLLYQDKTVDGLKTGYTKNAGYCLVSSAKRGDMRLISVVLGAKKESQRFSASRALLNYGFRFFETRELYAASKPLREIRIWEGESSKLPLGLTEPLYITVPRGDHSEVHSEFQVKKAVMAPIKEGIEVGEVVVNREGKQLTSAPLIALKSIPEAGFVGRMWDKVVLWVYSFFD